MRLNILVAALVSVAAPVAAQRVEPLGGSSPAVRTAIDRGALLYLYDEAAWKGTDDLMARHAALMPLLGGYVVSGEQGGVELVFYDKIESKALYRATFVNQKMIFSGPPAPSRIALTPVEMRLIGSRMSALKAFEGAKVGQCNKAKRNLALLPSKSPGGPVRAYLMTARTNMKSLPLGGHYAVDVSADGKAGPVRAFTKTCLELAITGDGKGQPAALVVSHLLDPTPTEIHVFSALTGKVPVYVMTMTNKQMWVVTGRDIRHVPSPPNARK